MKIPRHAFREYDLRGVADRDLSDELRVSGTVDEVRILGVVATKEGLLVRASATGSAQLSVVHRVR